jgi:hypothetical protein
MKCKLDFSMMTRVGVVLGRALKLCLRRIRFRGTAILALVLATTGSWIGAATAQPAPPAYTPSQVGQIRVCPQFGGVTASERVEALAWHFCSTPFMLELVKLAPLSAIEPAPQAVTEEVYGLHAAVYKYNGISATFFPHRLSQSEKISINTIAINFRSGQSSASCLLGVSTKSFVSAFEIQARHRNADGSTTLKTFTDGWSANFDFYRDRLKRMHLFCTQ